MEPKHHASKKTSGSGRQDGGGLGGHGVHISPWMR